MAKYLKIDGVDLNVDWVKGMSKRQFLKNEQVLALFNGREKAMSTAYDTIVGKRPSAPIEEKSDLPEPNGEETQG